MRIRIIPITTRVWEIGNGSAWLLANEHVDDGRTCQFAAPECMRRRHRLCVQRQQIPSDQPGRHKRELQPGLCHTRHGGCLGHCDSPRGGGGGHFWITASANSYEFVGDVKEAPSKSIRNWALLHCRPLAITRAPRMGSSSIRRVRVSSSRKPAERATRPAHRGGIEIHIRIR